MIKLQNTEISDIKLGNTQVNHIYRGSELVWSKGIPIVSLEITGETEVVEGNTLQLGISYNPSNTTQQGVMWSSSDETKATVNSNGLVTTIADGSVVITATSIINGAISDTHNVTINKVSNLYAIIKPFVDTVPSSGYGIKEYNGWKYSVVRSVYNQPRAEDTFYWSDNSVAGVMRPLTNNELQAILGSNYIVGWWTEGITNTLPVDKWYPDEFYTSGITRCFINYRDTYYGCTGFKLSNLSAGTYIVRIWDVNNRVIRDGMLYKVNSTTITPFTGHRFTNSSPNVHGTSTSKPQLKEVTVTIGTGENINIITYLTTRTNILDEGAAISAIELEKIS